MIALALIAAAAPQAAPAAQAAEPPRAQLKCDRGGVSRTIGGSDWVAYGCDDGVSAALVSAASVSPALHLIVRPSGDSYSVSGAEGSDTPAADSAKDALVAMGTAGLRALIEAAQAVPQRR